MTTIKPFIISSQKYEPSRYEDMKELFKDEEPTFICPTYKQTITDEMMSTLVTDYSINKKVNNQYMNKSTVSLFLNHIEVLKHIEKNYKDGIFVVFESDVITTKPFSELKEFIEPKQNDWDLINIGSCFSYFMFQTWWEENLTNKDDKYRLIRKKQSRCTDSMIWSYQGVLKFLSFFRAEPVCNLPIDHYINYLCEKMTDFKQYWSFESYFNQKTVLGTLKSSLDTTIEMSKDETVCTYVGSRGLLKHCNVYQTPIISSNPYFDQNLISKLNELNTNNILSLYVCTAAIPAFVTQLSQINKPIILVTGDADETISTDLYNVPTDDSKKMAGPIPQDQIDKILESPFIVKWFAQNCLMNHPKLVHMPIGFDYHTFSNQKSPLDQEADLKTLIKNAKPFHERPLKIYSTFHFNIHRGDREDAYCEIPTKLIYYEPKLINRDQTWKTQIEYAFVASPYGNGPDCHRTWEALALGCIPIVKSSKMDPLFKDLPVLLVKNWSDITQKLLESTIETFKNTKFSFEKLTLNYWTKLFQNDNEKNEENDENEEEENENENENKDTKSKKKK